MLLSDLARYYVMFFQQKICETLFFAKNKSLLGESEPEPIKMAKGSSACQPLASILTSDAHLLSDRVSAKIDVFLCRKQYCFVF